MLEYIVYFFSVVIFGDAALIALLYFATVGNIDLLKIAIIGILATVATDSLWYAIGYWFPAGKIFGKMKIPTIKEKYSKFSEFFSQHSLKALFYSKFLLGLRTPVRALYGAKKLDYWSFLGVNAFAGALWIVLITLLATIFKSSLPDLENTLQEIIFAFSAMGICIAIIYLLARKTINKKFSLDP